MPHPDSSDEVSRYYTDILNLYINALTIGIEWIADKDIPIAADPSPPPDERVPDYHGPKTDWEPDFAPHRRSWATAKDLLNGKITNPNARRVLRDALDHADRTAPVPTPKSLR